MQTGQKQDFYKFQDQVQVEPKIVMLNAHEKVQNILVGLPSYFWIPDIFLVTQVVKFYQIFKEL